MKPLPHRIGYFGKLPSRSDFVKAAHDASLLAALDHWLAEVMDTLPENARWKTRYDALAPVHFAFLSPARRHAVAGHLVSSRDASGRRFPFMMMRPLDVPEPAAFARHCPLALAPLWASMAAAAAELLACAEPLPRLLALGDSEVALAAHCEGALAGFLDTGTVGSLGALLGRSDPRELVMAVGMLLQPLLSHAYDDIEKSLVLPLPASPSAAFPVAAFWLELVVPFLAGNNAELALYLTQFAGAPSLVIGFSSANARTLAAIVDPDFAQELLVTVDDTAWVDEPDASPLDLRTLSSYLEQPHTPLRLARDLYLQTFVGACS
ncbi:type VI secretion system-associated protein TagF [Pseudoduganella sp. GCM10020061]|uniref:type VI secretion system-associated protein TagF n=1 Tax=Pseudoduganella sp. GCM10020061 TaxID=3317345 RepID=UPI00363149B9